MCLGEKIGSVNDVEFGDPVEISMEVGEMISGMKNAIGEMLDILDKKDKFIGRN